MNRHLGSVKVIVLLVVGALLVAALYVFRPTPAVRPQQENRPAAVSVVSVEPTTYQSYVYTQGTVTPSREINLVTEVAGRITQVADNFANGSFFKVDDVLVGLDDRDYQYQLINANADIVVAERELALEKGRARQAKREWRDLGSKEANALSLREPQVKAAQAQVSSAVARRNQVLLNIERAKITAPFNGRIQQTQVNVGQYVTAGSTIARIYDDAYAEIRLPLTNKQIAQIGLSLGVAIDPAVAPRVELSANLAGKLQTWAVNLRRTEASVDTRTRFYFAVAEIPEPFNTERYAYPLVMGLFVEAKITGRAFKQVISVPEKSIIANQFIYIVDNKALQKRGITIVGKGNGKVWVQGDFKKGEQVVVSDVRVLQEGLNVSPNLIKE